jgi:hypothetical protein
LLNKARETFLERRPEFDNKRYEVWVTNIGNRYGDVYSFTGDLDSIDSMLMRFQKRYSELKDRKHLAKHLADYAKKIKVQSKDAKSEKR